MDWIQDLKDDMAQAGLEPGDGLIADDEIHRFDADGDKPRSGNGWYAVYPDPPRRAAYGSWKTGERYIWRESHNDEAGLSPAESNAIMKKQSEAKVARTVARQGGRDAAAERANAWLSNAGAAKPDHPYLVAKQIRAHGIKQSLDGKLLIPMRDSSGEVRSLQIIDRAGVKRFMKGGSARWLFHKIGDDSANIWIVEGYATGASLYEDLGGMIIVAFAAGNLLPAALATKGAYPRSKIMIMGDDDWMTDGNPGKSAAKVAAAEIGCGWTVPVFPDDRPEEATDYNDLAKLLREAGQ